MSEIQRLRGVKWSNRHKCYRAYWKRAGNRRTLHLGFGSLKECKLMADTAIIRFEPTDALLNDEANREEAQNRALRWNISETSSRYRGVFWNEPTESWGAEVTRFGKRVRLLGLNFSTEEEAAREHDRFLLSQFYKRDILSRLNFPPPDVPTSTLNIISESIHTSTESVEASKLSEDDEKVVKGVMRIIKSILD